MYRGFRACLFEELCKRSVGLGQMCVSSTKREIGKIMKVLMGNNEVFGLYSQYNEKLLSVLREGFKICLWLLSGKYNGAGVEFEKGKPVRMLLWKTRQ